MKSFRLYSGSKGETIRAVIFLLCGGSIFWVLHAYHELAGRLVAFLTGAVFVGLLFRRKLRRTLRRQYPHARWIDSLTIGFAIFAGGVMARLVLPEAEVWAMTMAFVLPGGACIGRTAIVRAVQRSEVLAHGIERRQHLFAKQSVGILGIIKQLADKHGHVKQPTLATPTP